VGRGGRQVAILLPLSGPRAEVGQSMLRAAQLALDAPDAPVLLARDTGGTPQGAAAAARAAIDAGAGLLLGPLTASETEAVAPLARNAGVAVLAFTNDPAQAQPGVWTLGITPAQQVRRLVAAAQTQGKSQFAALLPDSDFGRAMANALQQTTEARGLPAPIIRHYTPGMAAITTAVRDISGYANRRGPIDAQVRAARAKSTPEGRKEAAELVKQPIPPPPFDALLLADTGESLAELASLLPYYDLDRSMVRVLGPALWADPASQSGQVTGAWYAAPDPAARAAFLQGYTARYGAAPMPIADLAVDAASIARVLGGSGYSAGALTQSQGFAGVDGLLALQPDGRVRRGLAVFEVQRGGPQMVEPAPETLAAPGT
jgi:branched-chain amino acid transport system substrate-binding protein